MRLEIVTICFSPSIMLTTIIPVPQAPGQNFTQVHLSIHLYGFASITSSLKSIANPAYQSGQGVIKTTLVSQWRFDL